MLLALAAMLPALGGCAVYTAPKLSVTGASLTDESPDGLVITFLIAAENSNREQLPLRDIAYTLDLDGRRVFSGSRSPEATLARLAVQELRLPAAVALDAEHPRPRGEVSYRIEGTLTYVTPGKLAEVLYESGVPAPTASFSHTGTVDLGPPVHGG
jgi:hypothetical protein